MSVKNRFVALALVSLLVIGAWFALAFRPTHSRLSALRADVDATKQQVVDLEAQLQRLLALKRNEPQLRIKAAKMALALPVQPSVPDFILQVQDAANAVGIDFLSITPSLPAVPVDSSAAAAPVTTSADGKVAPQPAAPTTPLRTISVTISADGKFFEIENFVLKLEHLARALRIDDFSLSAGQGQSSPTGSVTSGDVLSSTMKLQMFMTQPQAAAGVTTSSGQPSSGAA